MNSNFMTLIRITLYVFLLTPVISFSQSVRSEHHIRLLNTNDKSKYVLLSAPTNLNTILSFEFPSANGTTGQVLGILESGKTGWINAGGSNFPSLTAGSMIFSGGGTDILQDNSNLFWNNTTKRLGIGTNQPSAALEVKGDFKLGDGGTTLNQIIKTSATISVSGANVNSAGYKSVVVTVVGARPNGSVIVNPRTQLHTANAVFFIAYSYVSADDEVTIVFAATSGTQNNFTNKVFDITVIQ